MYTTTQAQMLVGVIGAPALNQRISRFHAATCQDKDCTTFQLQRNFASVANKHTQNKTGTSVARQIGSRLHPQTLPDLG